MQRGTLAILLYQLRLPPIDYILSTLVKVGFSVGGVYALKSENYIKPEVYLQKEGPLKPSWRNMDR